MNQDGEFLDNGLPGSLTFLFDHNKYLSDVFQRPYSYLRRMSTEAGKRELEEYSYCTPHDLTDIHDCLQTLLNHCCLQKPTWMELTHFASFLNAQLLSSETSIYCNAALMKEDLPGMKLFVIRFLIQMSKDFATRSVEVSDQSQGQGFSKPDIKDRQRWENSPHPYIFFNEDGAHTMSFCGFKLDDQLNLIDERSGLILEDKIMSRPLHEGLKRQGVMFNRSIDDKTSLEKISDLCRVFGIDSDLKNPDPSYELTSDNMMKMLAIFMRFRSDIPVVIMGETGCGKTRLIRYMCDLIRKGKEADRLTRVLQKVESFIQKVSNAQNDRQRVAQAADLVAQSTHHRSLLAQVVSSQALLEGLKDSDQILRRIQTAQAAIPYPTSAQTSSSCSSSQSSTGAGSSLAASNEDRQLNNLIIMKTHGGVTEEQIYQVRF